MDLCKIYINYLKHSTSSHIPVKMTEKDYTPLNSACVRALNDKLYEKRKVAALEIER